MDSLRIVHATCSLDCPDSCSLHISVNGEGRAIKIQGNPDHPVTRGFLCAGNDSVPAGAAASRLGWNKHSRDQRGVNALTSETLTDFGGGPTFYSTLVEVRRAGGRMEAVDSM